LAHVLVGEPVPAPDQSLPRTVIDFPGNYRQYFSPPRHVMIQELSEAVEAPPVGKARHFKGKPLFKVRRVVALE
jgi:hypothetical protein